MTAAAWHPDPTGRHELRYWDGTQWTDHVSDNGVQTVSPLEPAAESAEGPTAAGGTGTDTAARSGGQAEPEASYPSQGQQPPGSAFAGITGDLVSGEYSEKAGTGPSRQNKRMLRVRVAEPFMAKQGSMVAYQGNVNFAYQGGGAGRFLKKAITGEGLTLMRVDGQGDVFLADLAKEVHILHLDNSGLSINGKNVLAFSASLNWNVERIKGGSMLAGGLFNTTLHGTGWVAITTDGDPVVLNPGEAPTFADANALVAWSTSLQTALRSTVTAGALIGRGSGEAFQVSFQGQGFVIVQPSEGLPEPAPSA
jgi:uncharacterized protein (AIM24 family)